MPKHVEKVILVRQENQYRRGNPSKGTSAEEWEAGCSQLYIDEINLDRPTQTITIEAVDDGDENPDFNYRIGLGTWQDSNEFVGVQPGTYDVFVENDNTGCIVHGVIEVIACDLTIDQFVYEDEFYDLQDGFIEMTVSTMSDAPVEVKVNGGEWIEKDGRTFKWEGLDEGEYTIKVRDEWGCAVSKTVTISNVEDQDGPTAPSNLTPSDVDEGESLRIDWDKSSDDETWVTGYRVYRSKTQGFSPGPGNLYADDVDGGLNPGSTDEEWQNPHWKDRAVFHDETYYYRITAMDARGNESGVSDELAVTFTDDAAPNPATNLSTSSGNMEADIAWDASSSGDVQEYNLYRSEDGGSTWTIIATLEGTSYTDTGLENSTQYHYYATAVDEAENESVASNTESVIPADETPPAVPSVSASVTEDEEEVDLSITLGDTDDLQGYNIYRAQEQEDGTVSAHSQVHQINTTSGSASWTDNDVEFDQTYYYKVTSFDEVPNESSQSDRAEATPFPDRTPPATPSISGGQKYFGENDVEITVTISDTTDLEGYNIYRSQSSGGPYTLVKQISSQSDEETWVDDGTEMDTEYFYVATSYDEGPNTDDSEPNESDYSNEISVTPEDVPQDQSVDVTLPANTVSAYPGFLGYDLSTLAEAIFWKYVKDNGDDIRIRKPDGTTCPMVLYDWDKSRKEGKILFSDPSFDPTVDQTYLIWFDDPDSPERDGTPAGRQAFADDFYAEIPDVQFLMLPGELDDNRVSDQSGVTINYIHDHLPEGWQKSTFAGTSNEGSVTHNGGQSYTFECGGDDIYDNTSHGEFLFKPVVGDCKITCKIILQENTNQYAKFGPYITSDVYERAPCALNIVVPNNGIRGTVRKSYNGNNNHDGGSLGTDVSPQFTSENPVWLQLERKNREIIYRYSTDGTNYTEMGRVSDFLPERIAAGLAGTSHDTGQLCTVEAREVAVEGNGGAFMMGDDQTLALDGVHFDPANSDTIEKMRTTLLIDTRVVRDNAGEGMVLSFDRNEYFRLSAPDYRKNRIGFDSHHNGSQYDSDNMTNYNFDEITEGLIQFLFQKRGSSDYQKEKWLNTDRQDYQTMSDPMIGDDKRYGLIGANSESAAFMDEAWSDKGPHHIFKFFWWALSNQSEDERQSEEHFLWRASTLWDFPIIYIFVSAMREQMEFQQLLGKTIQRDPHLIDFERQLEFKALLARAMERDPNVINPGASYDFIELLGNEMQRNPHLIDISIVPYVSPPTPEAEAGLSAVQEATVEYLLSTLEGVDTVEFLRTTGGPDGSYSNVKSLSVTSKSGSWADTGLDAFTTYYYALKSANSNGEESLGRSKERGVRTGSGNAVNLRAITAQNTDANGYEIIVDSQSDNGGLEYNLDGGTWQSSNTFSVEEGSTYTVGVKDSSGAETSMEVTVPTLAVGESEALFENKLPIAPATQAKDFDGSAGEATFGVKTTEIDIEALEVHRKADGDTSYSLIEKITYPLLPTDYTDNNYDESKGHVYKARVTDVAGQTGPFSDVIKPSFFEDFEGDLSEWTVNYSPFEIKTDRVYEGSQAAGADSYSSLPSSGLAIERQMGSHLQQPSKASWYWNEDGTQYGSAFHFINSNGNLEVALGTQNPQWQAWDGTGMNDEIWGANGYDRWIYYEITFDWANGEYNYYMEDLQTGDTRSGTRQLKHGVDVAKIGLGERVGETSRHYTWWDNITIK
jgi:fibronectin type 3 domain-containing protein